MRSVIFVVLAGGCGFQVDLAGDAGMSADVDADTNRIDASLVSDVAPPSPLSCPSGYQSINGVGMYRAVEGPQTWPDAADDCNDDDDEGGPFTGHTHLVVLGSDVERLAITNGATPLSGNTWIGLSDRAIEGTYAWVTSEPTNGYPIVGMHPPWDSDDPDDAGGEEDCIRFKNGFALEDKPCDDELRYVCECDAFPPN